jgi:hypothetical protein
VARVWTDRRKRSRAFGDLPVTAITASRLWVVTGDQVLVGLPAPFKEIAVRESMELSSRESRKFVVIAR